ncbi:MAG: hypothetical protein ACRCVA_30635 [Phreatobacter sp.]|jgi:hypothetical protein
MRGKQEVIAMMSQGLNAMKAMVGSWLLEHLRPADATEPRDPTDPARRQEERDRMILSQMPR